MRWFIYNFLFAFAYVVMLPHYLMRMRKRGGYAANFNQRFGHYAPSLRARLEGQGMIWIHAVSVGEVYMAGQLMRALREADPGRRFVLSTTSSTGWHEAESVVAPQDTLIYNPLDFPHTVRRALDTFRPCALVLVDTELWPNWIRACARRGIPLFLVNGRMSDSTAAVYRRLRYWFGPVLRLFDTLGVQSALDAQRFRDAGADPERIAITGSFKYDVARRNPVKETMAAAFLERLGITGDHLLLLGGSTWPGEEETLLSIYRELCPVHPTLRLALAPRHFERRDEVATQIRAAGLVPLYKSRLDSGDEPFRHFTQNDVLLLDTTGELVGFYPYAAMVFVGRSLGEAQGGQNMIEPCLCGVPALVGPHTQNFRPVMADLIAEQCILQVRNTDELRETTARLLSSPGERRDLGARAARMVVARQGVVDRCAQQILERAAAGGCAQSSPTPTSPTDKVE